MNLNPTQVLLIGFGLGSILLWLFFALTQKDFLGSYLAVRFGKGKRLLCVHATDGFNVFWKVGFLKEGMWQYKHKKGDVRVFTITDGCVVRSMGVNLLHLPEGVTAPFNFSKTYEKIKRVEVPKIDDKGEPVLDEEGSPITVLKDYVYQVFFDAYSDAKSITEVLESALSKKASRASLTLGNIDFKRLLIIAAVIIGAWFVIKNFVLSGNIPVIQ